MMDIFYLTPASEELIEAVAYYDDQVYNIKNKDLLEKLRKLQELSGEDQKAVTLVLDAFIRKHGIKKLNDAQF